ncbi:MAG: ATP-binding protein [Azonexus sp.]|nr:ATP-binding protein [Azonexus sp.]
MLAPLYGAEADAQPMPIRSHAIIGQNGTGKSNLIEALVMIFRDIDLDRDAAFDYTLEYSIGERTVRIEADTAKQKRPFVKVNGKQQSQKYLLENRELLPSHVFAYYSGRNERLEELFREHQRRFSRRQETVVEEKLSAGDLARLQSASGFDPEAAKRLESDIENRDRHLGDDRLRRLFYCRGGHSQLVLLACLLSNDPMFQKIMGDLGIEALESALFVLKEPHRLREKRRNGRLDDNDFNEGDPRFWYARGNVVSEFLDKLWQVAWAPIEQEADKRIDFRGRSEKQRQLYLFVPSHEKLKELGEQLGSADSFFRYAEGAYIGDLIEEVRITVKKRDEDAKVSFSQLSEGELQLLTVLGLMRITRDRNCLFLLDEPDTHLNPIWKLRYFDEIKHALGSDEDAASSQILLTTHDPMMIGGLRKEQVRVLRSEDKRTAVLTPVEHPQGMGVAGLLKSDVFGLSSTLDQQTLDDLQRRNELLAKQAKQSLTHREQGELERLRHYLDELGFSREYRDPMYQLFIQKMYEARSQPLSQLLPEKELKAQEALAEKIAQKLIIEERTGELAELAKALKVKK